ncbi:MAG: hypothetical protein CFE32_07085, partial [Alphaproteobacteria bacterium PA3]
MHKITANADMLIHCQPTLCYGDPVKTIFELGGKEPECMERSAYTEMAAIDENHWWYRARRRIVA